MASPASSRALLHRVCSPAQHQQVAHLHATPASSAISPLFALQALANSRETRHFNKVSGLSRIEHSPTLELLRSSEVDPFQSKQSLGGSNGEAAGAEHLRQRTWNGPASRGRSAVSASGSITLATHAPIVQSRPQQQATTIDVDQSMPGPAPAAYDVLTNTLLRLERTQEGLQASWQAERRVLAMERERFRRVATLLSLLGIAGAVITTVSLVALLGGSEKFYAVPDLKARRDAHPNGRVVDKETMWSNAANAMSGTRKEAYSALEPVSAVVAPAPVDVNAPISSRTTHTGWFWR